MHGSFKHCQHWLQAVLLVSSFHLQHNGYLSEDFKLFFFHTCRTWVFDGVYVVDTIWVDTPRKEPSYLDEIIIVSIWFQNGIDSNYKVSGIQKLLQCKVPTKSQYPTGITT